MKRVLIANDGSRIAERAAEFLARLPHDDRLRITVVSVLQETAYHRDAEHDWARRNQEQRHEALAESFSRIGSLFEGSNVELDFRTRYGHAGKEIVALGDELGADLIVVGAKGHSTVARLLLGSTSDYVATHSDASVLVFRPTEADQRDAIRVALAFDGGQPARDMIEEFSETAWGPQIDAQVVTVLKTKVGPFGRVMPDQDEVAISFRRAKVTRDAIASVAPRCGVRIIKDEHVADGLVRYTKEAQTDLIFVGESRGSRLDHLLLGSIAKFVLRHSRCSVWIARAQRRPSAPPESATSAVVALGSKAT